MLLFWAIFDGILGYIIPILITDLGYSKTQMGLIIASSNVFGAIFDFFLCKFIKNTNYRRLFLLFYLACFSYPLLLWSSKTVFIFVVSMAVWGLYGDLQNFASFDFVGNHSKAENCQKFGIMGVFRSLGYIIAPILAGLLITSVVKSLPFIIAFIFILISFLFYLVLVRLSKKDPVVILASHRRSNFFKEFYLWKRIGLILLPVLLLNTLMYVFDATFWVIGPLFANNFIEFKGFGGLFVAAYMFPTLLVGWFIGSITSKLGKKKTALLAFLFSNILLLPLIWFREPILILTIVFISSFAGSIAWPSLRAAYADYINETDIYDKEIEGLNDFSANLGYIIGPIMAGFVADRVGIHSSFTFLAVINIVLVIFLLFLTPKKININI